MRPDPQIPDTGSKIPRGTQRATVPKQSAPQPTLGRWDEDRLPPESREQWRQTLGMRTTCLMIAYKYVPWHSREDVWQETKFSMWRRLTTGPVDHLSAYVKRACNNEGLEQLKKLRARAELFIGADLEALESRTPIFDARIDARIKDLLASFRPELTEHEARIFVLRAGLRWPIRNVAMALDLTDDAVKSAYRTAKKKLKQPETRNKVRRLLNPE